MSQPKLQSLSKEFITKITKLSITVADSNNIKAEELDGFIEGINQAKEVMNREMKIVEKTLANFYVILAAERQKRVIRNNNANQVSIFDFEAIKELK